jgi:hypothetical protein
MFCPECAAREFGLAPLAAERQTSGVTKSPLLLDPGRKLLERASTGTPVVSSTSGDQRESPACQSSQRSHAQVVSPSPRIGPSKSCGSAACRRSHSAQARKSQSWRGSYSRLSRAASRCKRSSSVQSRRHEAIPSIPVALGAASSSPSTPSVINMSMPSRSYSRARTSATLNRHATPHPTRLSRPGTVGKLSELVEGEPLQTLRDCATENCLASAARSAEQEQRDSTLLRPNGARSGLYRLDLRARRQPRSPGR